MPANLFGKSELEWGMAEETGVLAQSYSKAVSGEEKVAKNHEGDTVGVSEYDPVAEHSIEAHIAGGDGVATAEFGAELSLANASNEGGVGSGLIIVTNVTFNLENENYKSISVTAKQWPEVTAAA